MDDTTKFSFGSLRFSQICKYVSVLNISVAKYALFAARKGKKKLGNTGCISWSRSLPIRYLDDKIND